MLHQLSVTLGVPRHRLLLLREEVELRADATVGALGLGIADIIGQLPSALMLKVLLKSCPGSRGRQTDHLTTRVELSLLQQLFPVTCVTLTTPACAPGGPGGAGPGREGLASQQMVT